MPQVSPLRVLRNTRLWLPAVALVIALIVLAVSWSLGRTADQLEAHGVLAEGVVIAREIHERQDDDGMISTSYSVAYRFEPADGPPVFRRRDVSFAVFASVAEGDRLTVRHLPGRPAVHEMRIGDARADAEEARAVGVAALVIAVGMGLWLGVAALPLLRALGLGRVRQAWVTEHLESRGRRADTGERYGRIRWRDDTGALGESGDVPMLDVVSHPVGSRIRIVVDPVTGRSWWEEELSEDPAERWLHD